MVLIHNMFIRCTAGLDAIARTATQNVPAPATLAPFGLGLLVGGFVRRKSIR